MSPVDSIRAVIESTLAAIMLLHIGCTTGSPDRAASITTSQEQDAARRTGSAGSHDGTHQPPSATISELPDSTSPPRTGQASPFLGQSEPVSLAVAEFSTNGALIPPDLGKSVADRLCNRLPAKRFRFVERSRLNRIIEERDLQSTGIVGDSPDSLTSAAYVLLGGVSAIQGVELSVRLVEVGTGRVARRAWVRAESAEQLDSALDYLAAVVSASDGDYDQLEVEADRRAEAELKQALDAPEVVSRVNGSLVIKVRSTNVDKDEARLYQQVRQRVRELFTSYCQDELHLPKSKNWLVDYCRRSELCEDVTTRGSLTTFTFRVPIPQ